MVGGDLPDVLVEPGDVVGCGTLAEPVPVDDLLVFVELSPIDGAGGILGQAGPCLLREGDLLPAAGLMRFDTDDLQALEARNQLEPMILHEMLHVMGFGVLWRYLSLLSGGGTPDPVFTGPLSRDAFLNLEGGTPIPARRCRSRGGAASAPGSPTGASRCSGASS